jgi:hypothetical protein
MPDMSSLTAAGVWVAVIGFFGLLVRQLVLWRAKAQDAEAQFRDALIRRVERLEARIDRQQVRHDAEKRLLTHKLRNMTANFDSMLMMLEMNPDRGPEIVAKIKEQRASQMVAEAKESAIISKAELGEPEEEE